MEGEVCYCLPCSRSYVNWFSDSLYACKIVQMGSTKSDLQVIVLEIVQFCADNSIGLELSLDPSY